MSQHKNCETCRCVTLHLDVTPQIGTVYRLPDGTHYRITGVYQSRLAEDMQHLDWRVHQERLSPPDMGGGFIPAAWASEVLSTLRRQLLLP